MKLTLPLLTDPFLFDTYPYVTINQILDFEKQRVSNIYQVNKIEFGKLKEILVRVFQSSKQFLSCLIQFLNKLNVLDRTVPLGNYTFLGLC